MSTIHIEPDTDIKITQLLESISQLETPELEQFLSSVSLILSHRKEIATETSEVELLQQINQGLPPDIQQRYDKLRAKLRAETLTAEEHRELIDLVDVVEQADADRLKHLIALSQLRQVSLDDLLQQLGIRQPTVNV